MIWGAKERAREAARDLLTVRGFMVAEDVEIFDDEEEHPVELLDCGAAWVTCRIRVRDTASPPESHVSAAKAIILRWADAMKADTSMVVRRGRSTIREWLEAASKDSAVMHDNCDVNEIFAEVLIAHGLIPAENSADDEATAATWNSVTNDYGMLEDFAAELAKEFP